MSMQDYEAKMEVLTCDICNRPDVPLAEVNEVEEYLRLVSIEEFACIIEAMGISQQWETAVICKTCLDYYKE